MTFGETIREAREARGLTQTALAEAVGLSSSRLSRIERDKQDPEAPERAALVGYLELEAPEAPDFEVLLAEAYGTNSGILREPLLHHVVANALADVVEADSPEELSRRLGALGWTFEGRELLDCWRAVRGRVQHVSGILRTVGVAWSSPWAEVPS